ncbi:hypothetical protein ACFQ1E_09885 [Sphingomonas canadensis]|uniref:Uncharacterized protein n=1 Tax=Sphingomonas canadensis TaxID=1219257 RepID=A0ABW3H5C3_9SPHN|nr:hypothetical protein [Sphingomonas canadensis]MCW3836571.1 hypothetical protein [Sphingomonas canadensis]
MRRIFAPVVPLALLAALSACTADKPAPPPRPLPAPPPVPLPPPPPPPPPAPAPADWRDVAVAPGTWAWRQDARGSIALFGRPGAPADLTVRCDRQRGRVYVARLGDGAQQLTVRTSSTMRALPVTPTGGDVPYVAFELAPRDPLLDAMGHTRGRFAVLAERLAPLAVPAWAELLRVIEDCR